MKTEFEATFKNIDKENVRKKFEEAGAELVRPEFIQKRVSFFPPGSVSHDKWLRVRDEGDKITVSLKELKGEKIDDQKELQIIVDDFDGAVAILENIGCKRKGYQETKRELWLLDRVEITIDEWPFLEPFVEVEGSTESEVKLVSEKIGFDYSDALFCVVTKLYEEKYGLSADEINTTPTIIFDMDNPFLKENKS